MGPEAFDYALPPELVAQHPAARRSDARLLVLGEQLADSQVRELPRWLPDDALVVVNASRVVPARLVASRDDGRAFELLLCAPKASDGPEARIAAWVRGAKRLRHSDRLEVGPLVLRYDRPDDTDPRARWFVVESGRVLDACHDAGQVPLPPYIARPDGPQTADASRYQTVYANKEGSVAAPTAGLHLDETLLRALDVVELHLHVGPGTFLPMEVDDVSEHRVGGERIELDAEAAERIESARAQGRPIVAVGTTVTRALESIAASGPVRPYVGQTELVITPGFRFQAVTHLLTNFHLPRSSLLMLVCSLAGRERVLMAYEHAVAQRYRFYSYGDAMLVKGAP